jgi:hypothetical protein
MHWHEVLRHYYSIASVVITTILAVYYGPKAIMDTWNWYCFRLRDQPVYDMLLGRIYGKHYGHGFTLAELATKLGRKESSVLRSLARLKTSSKAVTFDGEWLGKL